MTDNFGLYVFSELFWRVNRVTRMRRADFNALCGMLFLAAAAPVAWHLFGPLRHAHVATSTAVLEAAGGGLLSAIVICGSALFVGVIAWTLFAPFVHLARRAFEPRRPTADALGEAAQIARRG